MPVISLDEHIQNASPVGAKTLNPTPKEPKKTSSTGAFLDAVVMESPIISYMKHYSEDRLIPLGELTRINRQSEYQPLDNIPARHLDKPEKFMYLISQEEVDEQARILDERDNFNKLAAQHPISSTVGAMVGGIISPTTFLPVGTAFNISKTGSTLAQVAKNGAKVASASAGAIAFDEAILRETTGKTLRESTADMIFGSALGGGVGFAISARLARKAKKELNNIMVTGNPDTGVVPKKATEQQLDAEIDFAKENFTGESLAGLNKGMARAVTHPIELYRSPTVNLTTSDLKTSNAFANDMFDHNLFLEKNLPDINQARGPVFEVEMQQQFHPLVHKYVKNSQDLYNTYAGSWKGNLTASAYAKIKGKLAGKISRKEFEHRAAKVMASEGKLVDEIAEVNKFARSTKELLNDMAMKLKEKGLLQEDFDPNYLMHRYNRNMMKAKKPEVTELFAKAFRKGNPDLTASEANKSARKAVENIIGTGELDTQINQFVSSWKSGKSVSFLKKRNITIPTAELLDMGVLNTNLTAMVGNYVDKVGRITLMQDFLAKRGYKSFDDIINKLTKEANDLTSNPKITEKERRRIFKQFERDKRDIEVTWNGLMSQPAVDQFGRGNDPVALQIWREFVSYKLLGSMTLSSLSEAFVTTLRFGAAQTFWDGMFTKVRNAKLAKLSNDELKDLMIGVQHEIGAGIHRIIDPDAALHGIDTTLAGVSGVTRQTFANLTGMSYWMTFWQRVAAKSSLSSTMRKLKRWDAGKKLSPKEITELNAKGINEKDFKGILQQFNKYGYDRDGSYIMNLNEWDNKNLADKLSSSIILDTNSSVNLPGVGDIPAIFQKSGVGKTVYQFQSFFGRAAHSVMLSGLQRRDKEFAMGIIGMVLAGGVIENIKSTINPNRKTPENTAQWLTAGAINSGALGLVGTHGAVLLAGPGEGRYGAERTVGTFLGPTFSIAKGATESIYNVTDGDITEKDMERLIKTLPFTTLPYIQALINETIGKE